MTTLALKAHLAINVHNLASSVDFYRKLFGVEPSKVRTGYAKFDLANPLLNFSLNEHPFKEAGALSHMGIQVRSTSDVMAMRRQWHDRGLITRDEMQTDCCFATQDKTWVKDPDGNEWEAFVVLQDNLPEREAGPRVESCSVPAGSTAHSSEEAAAGCACFTAASNA